MEKAPWEKPERAPWEKEVEEPGLLSKGLQTGLKALDYLGGVSRTAAANVLEPFTDKNVVSTEDVKKALKGEAPSSAEYLERAGVPAGDSFSDAFPALYSESGEGLALQKGGILDPTVRGAAGFALDTATDPLTYASGGLSALKGKLAKYAKTAVAPTDALAESLGKKLYKSGFKNVDKDLIVRGKEPISETLLREGFSGNMEQARKANLALQQRAAQGIDDVTREGAKLGATVDPFKASQEAHDFVQKLKKSPHPNDQAAAEGLENLIQSYVSRGENIPIDVANKWKSDLYKKATEKAFTPTVHNLPNQDMVEKLLAKGLKGDIESSLGKTSSELLEKLKTHNTKFGSSRSAEKAFDREFKKEVTKNLSSQVDAALLGGSAIEYYTNPDKVPYALSLYGAKKLGGALNSTPVRTKLGKALYQSGVQGTGMKDALMRRSAWELLKEKENK